MKSLLISALMLSSLTAMANMHHQEEWQKKMDAMSFEDAKKMETEALATKKTMVEEAQACISAAKDKPALKACNDKMMKEHEQMHSKMKNEMDMKKKKM